MEGQALIGYITATAGFVLALTAPFLGAIADKDGRRKPWLIGTVGAMSLGALCLWFVEPAGQGGLSLGLTLAILFLIKICFTVSEVFHNAMLPSIAPINRVGLISGMAFSLGNVGGLLLMLFVLLAFAMPGTQPWAFLPTRRCSASINPPMNTTASSAPSPACGWPCLRCRCCCHAGRQGVSVAGVALGKGRCTRRHADAETRAALRQYRPLSAGPHVLHRRHGGGVNVRRRVRVRDVWMGYHHAADIRPVHQRLGHDRRICGGSAGRPRGRHSCPADRHRHQFSRSADPGVCAARHHSVFRACRCRSGVGLPLLRYPAGAVLLLHQSGVCDVLRHRPVCPRAP